jgi:hypothetical protein
LPENAAGLRVSNRGRIDMVEEHGSVRQAILLLLSTRPGERIMRPNYGCHLHRLIFAPNDETTAGLAIHYVRQAISRWEPRIEVIRIDATRDLQSEAPATLLIVFEYRVLATQKLDRITFPFDLMGERS